MLFPASSRDEHNKPGMVFPDPKIGGEGLEWPSGNTRTGRRNVNDILFPLIHELSDDPLLAVFESQDMVRLREHELPKLA